MKITNNNLWLALAVLVILPICLQAQNTVRLAHDKIRVDKLQVEKEEDGLEVKMILNLDSLEMASNRFMELTPVLTNGENAVTLAPIVIAGRRQHIMYQRNRETGIVNSGRIRWWYGEKTHRPVC